MVSGQGKCFWSVVPLTPLFGKGRSCFEEKWSVCRRETRSEGKGDPRGIWDCPGKELHLSDIFLSQHLRVYQCHQPSEHLSFWLLPTSFSDKTRSSEVCMSISSFCLFVCLFVCFVSQGAAFCFSLGAFIPWLLVPQSLSTFPSLFCLFFFFFLFGLKLTDLCGLWACV